MVTVVYAYHFVSIILGMDTFVHWTRFQVCGTVKKGDYQGATDVYDGPLMAVLIFHIIEWVR